MIHIKKKGSESPVKYVNIRNNLHECTALECELCYEDQASRCTCIWSPDRHLPDWACNCTAELILELFGRRIFHWFQNEAPSCRYFLKKRRAVFILKKTSLSFKFKTIIVIALSFNAQVFKAFKTNYCHTSNKNALKQ